MALFAPPPSLPSDSRFRPAVSTSIFVIYPLIAMQLLEIITYGPNTFGTHKQNGGNSENIDENIR
jgi:hypothetical protein